ncbi:Wzz/FepE/Etk N-terminal domain-containing protein [uncultured Polaribacter sp.]|uniref:Wzz/FepE/Etk N-terminal domain-containing protein n=1 Tax=uncultured Polaribacter sp. TaxID=174711 RepID=UPI00262B18F6|nr:Wzz/FepE/Etk N-terminal domain-containing protein [uncultured Polaribacter sp.]
MQENKNTYIEPEDTIDIIALLKGFWQARKLILKITLVFSFLGLFVAIFSKNEYTASTTFVPLVQGKTSASGLGSLASLAGISLGGGVNNTEISPELYPQIVASIPFQLALLETNLTIQNLENDVTYKEFYENVYSAGLLANIKKYTLGLPLVVVKLFRSKSASVGQNITQDNQEIITISDRENELIELISSQINLNVNVNEGFVSLEVTFPEAKASAQLALKAQQLLQDFALYFKTQKSKEQLQYIKERYVEKQNEFNKVKISLARFQDRNTSINTALGKSKLLQLQSEYDLAFSVYSELAKQLETQRLQVKKDTPLFTVLKPVSVPNKKSAPKRSLILIIYVFLGLVSSIGYLLVKKYLKIFRKQWLLR